MQIATETDDTRNESNNVTNFNRKRIQKRQQQKLKWKAVIVRSINIKLMHKQKHSFPLALAWPSNGTTNITSTLSSLQPLTKPFNSLFEGSYRCSKEVQVRWCTTTSPQQSRECKVWVVVCNRLLKIDLECVPLGMVKGRGYHPGF